MEKEQGDLVSAIGGRMKWLSERQRVLAQNVANADTANYKPKDVAPFDFKQSLQQAMVVPAVTQPNHILAGHGAKPGVKIINSPVFETLPSGNAVNLESEMLKVSETGMDYQQMATLMRKWHVLMKVALGR